VSTTDPAAPAAPLWTWAIVSEDPDVRPEGLIVKSTVALVTVPDPSLGKPPRALSANVDGDGDVDGDCCRC
jgi:hypothetical protein